MIYDYEKYGIKVGQVYKQADGSPSTVEVTDVDTYKDCGDVVVKGEYGKEYRIDCFKLTMVRYSLAES